MKVGPKQAVRALAILETLACFIWGVGKAGGSALSLNFKSRTRDRSSPEAVASSAWRSAAVQRPKQLFIVYESLGYFVLLER